MAFITFAPVTPRASVARVSCSTSAFNGARMFNVAKPRAAMLMSLDTIKVRIAEEMKRAKEASDKFGAQSQEARVAWDVVEELEAEFSHMKANTTPKDPLEDYCKEEPDADECRTYDD